MSTWPFAISTHLYHDQRLSRDHLVEIAAHGFDGVELFVNRPHCEAGDEAMWTDIGEAVRDSQLKVHALHAPIAAALKHGEWTGPLSIASSDDRVRSAAVKEVEQTLQIARAVPVDCVVVHVGVPDAQRPGAGENQRDAARRSVEALASAAQALGVRVALEVMPNALSSPEALVSLIEDDLEGGAVGICLDLGHAFLMTGDVADAIETVSGHLIATHVHDNRGRTDDHLLPFEGRIDWESTLMTLQKVGYDGALTFELAAAADTRAVLERAARVRERFDTILQG